MRACVRVRARTFGHCSTTRRWRNPIERKRVETRRSDVFCNKHALARLEDAVGTIACGVGLQQWATLVAAQ
eukprot:5803176-Pleurochrysis_carterae.AAC.1